MTEYKELAAFAREAAAYTGGGDMAFWANVTNAENCLQLASAIEALEARCKRLEEALREISSPTQTEKLLWWQSRSRLALQENTNGG